MTNAALGTIADVAPTLAALKKLPLEQQSSLLLARLAVIYPQVQSAGGLHKGNLLLPDDPHGLAAGYSHAENSDVRRQLLGTPWTMLVNQGYIVDPEGKGFYSLTDEGRETLRDAKTSVSSVTPNTTPTGLPQNVRDIDLLKWVVANPNKPFDPNMLVSTSHTSDWQWQAVLAQMEGLGRQGYITKLKQDGGGSTYWTITGKGENYLRALERAENASEELEPAKAAPSDLVSSSPGATTQPPSAEVALRMLTTAFGADTIPLNGTTSLTFTIINPESQPMTGVAPTADLPGGLAVSTPNGLTGSYGGGSVTAENGSNKILLSGASLAPKASLSFSVNVIGTDAGKKDNIAFATAFLEKSTMNQNASASVVVLGEPVPGAVPVKKESGAWLDKATIERFGDKTWTILDSADRIREVRKGPAVSAFDLVMAFGRQPGGQLPDLLEQAGVSLDSLISETADASAEGLPEDAASGAQRKLPRITPYVRMALERARDKADGTGSATIEDSHLLFGLLSLTETDNLLIQGLNSKGITPDKVKLPDQLDTFRPDETRVIASYQSEDWNGRDLLNIRRDVNALASLVAGWNVQPPLSIGLFGEWGSGKSFFMRQMRTRVKQLSMAAQASGRAQRECAYYKHIVQVEFNAWHYMEGNNLWACLVEHIFSNLGLPQDTTAAQIENRQKQTLERIGARKILEQQAAARRKELETKKEEAQKKANAANSELDAKKVALEKERSGLWEKINLQLSNEVEGILQSIPEAVKLRDSVETVRTFCQEAQTLSGRASLLWNLFRHDPQRRKILYWMIGGSAASFVLLRIVHVAAPNVKLLLQPAFQVIVPLASALVMTANKFWPMLRKIKQVVVFFETKNQEITAAIAKAEKAQKQQIANLENDVMLLSHSVDQARNEEREHQEAIVALESELAAIDANRLLAEFIKSRADADDYRKHLGMVALVRRDFEHLSDLFRSQRKDEEQGRERLDDNTVNRIILYIDDLDRCSPQTVVTVLQAIHLLLAFPIFVVVVAVDSRWVSRSLERCYDWLVPANPSAPVGQTELTNERRPRGGPGATAHDYLEKIFQIPFWLAPMDSRACQLMIRGLTQAASDEQSALQKLIANKKEQQRPAKSQVIATNAKDKTTTVLLEPQANSISTPPPLIEPLPDKTAAFGDADQTDGAEQIDLSPEQLEVSEPELKKIDELAVLIGRSPRVAKRFLNCYRLLKARMDKAELQKFLAGRFQDVMEVLAIVVGAPSIANDVLRTLCVDASDRENTALLEQLTENLGATTLSTVEGAELMRLLGSASADHLRSLRSVVPLVSRFSFQLQSDNAVKHLKHPQTRQYPPDLT